ncbi:hypothetical protein H0A36_24600 [Endozoicomonas sp. SM1973]|uniref:Tripartite tricarboxylate transporter substrate binding protein n=1 Tax=Spartinivicinus marinus TaxID=2994442 RepID=A0A853IBI7_9GAMM|nr:tripartite tricarboxylate transporter substrate-binding protein [Spartinivicinus marinus]MCX4025390.1 tripartite tricarboxylate transporter substrate-binding protein [Spartinivicinus marinus]NYZ69202.1 hypothetical protein [Spartinivicinus marinus]
MLRIIVPYGRGGGSDQLSRAMGNAIQKATKIKVIITNRPDRGGAEAVDIFARLKPKDWVILQATDNLIANYINGIIKLHPTKELIPIAITQLTFSQIYIHPQNPHYSNWQEFLQYAKTKPTTIANVGNRGSMEYLSIQGIELNLGVTLHQKSYDRPNHRYQALLNGEVNALIEQPGDVDMLLNIKSIKPILTLLDKRPLVFKEVPSLPDVGLSLTPLYRFRGFFALKATPKKQLKWLETIINQAWQTPAFQAFNKEKHMHLLDSYMDSKQATLFINQLIETYRNMSNKTQIN